MNIISLFLVIKNFFSPGKTSWLMFSAACGECKKNHIANVNWVHMWFTWFCQRKKKFVCKGKSMKNDDLVSLQHAPSWDVSSSFLNLSNYFEFNSSWDAVRTAETAWLCKFSSSKFPLVNFFLVLHFQSSSESLKDFFPSI